MKYNGESSRAVAKLQKKSDMDTAKCTVQTSVNLLTDCVILCVL